MPVAVDSIHRRLARLLFASLFVLCAQNACAADAGQDSVAVARRPRPANTTLELIVSFPGQLAYAPLKYTILGLGYGGVYLAESGTFSKLASFVQSTGLVAVYAPRTGGGAKYVSNHFLSRPVRFQCSATTWFDLRQSYALQWKNVRLARGVDFDYALRYRSLVQEHFYGIGPETSENNKTVYAAEDALFEVTLRSQLSSTLHAALDIGVSNTSVFQSREDDNRSITKAYSDSTLPGLRDKVRLQGTELSINYIDTNHPGHPTTGKVGKLGATIFTDIRDDRFSFWKLGLDITQYVHLFHDRVLALRGAGEMTQGLDDPEIPFYHLAELGSHGTIRGFSRGRFRDNDMLLASAEYRYPIWIPWAKIVDAVVFADGGQVMHDVFEDTALADLQTSIGGGFRFYGSEILIARTEIAFSSDGYQVYLTLNAP